jgi:16S rRNA (uracil1498-N3)-methyltransferase
LAPDPPRAGFRHPFGQPVTQVVLDSLAPDRVRVEGDDARHLAQSLRLAAGDTFVATDGRGGVARLTALALERRGIDARIDARAQVPPPDRRVWLVTDAPGGRGDWLVEKAVELGAHGFAPLGQTSQGRLERWRRVARAGLKQSLSAWELVLLTERPALAEAKARAGAGFRAWVAEPGGAPVLSEILPPQGDVFLVCGPPGGFGPGDRESWEALEGASRVDLGPLRLRAETAALVLLAAAALPRFAGPARPETA